jgi:hypothetical protein
MIGSGQQHSSMLVFSRLNKSMKRRKAWQLCSKISRRASSLIKTIIRQWLVCVKTRAMSMMERLPATNRYFSSSIKMASELSTVGKAVLQYMLARRFVPLTGADGLAAFFEQLLDALKLGLTLTIA